MLSSLLKRLLRVERPAEAAGSVDPPQNDDAHDDSRFYIDWGLHTLLRLVTSYEFKSVLDVGSGPGEHARLFRHLGKEVYSVDESSIADYVGDFNKLALNRRFDVVWCSHVLEHQRNVGVFLEKAFDALEDHGILAVTVPSHPRERLIAGHVTSWNAGLLCYNLVLAGFDCSAAQLLQSFELACIVRKKQAAKTGVGHYDPDRASKQLAELSIYFPFPVRQGCDAEILNANWGAKDYRFPAGAGRITIISKNIESPLIFEGKQHAAV